MDRYRATTVLLALALVLMMLPHSASARDTLARPYCEALRRQLERLPTDSPEYEHLAERLLSECERPVAPPEQAVTPHALKASDLGITMADPGTLGGEYSRAMAVNDLGQVVGDSVNEAGETRAFLWTVEEGMIDLGTLGGADSRAFAVNNLGQVIGTSSTAIGATHAFRWTAGDGMVDLGTLGGVHSRALAINNLGQVVGTSVTADGETCAFLWTEETGIVDLGTLGGKESRALAMNDSGQVVGYSHTDAEWHAVIWTTQLAEDIP